jgi:hypothetical protein
MFHHCCGYRLCLHAVGAAPATVVYPSYPVIAKSDVLPVLVWAGEDDQLVAIEKVIRPYDERLMLASVVPE